MLRQVLDVQAVVGYPATALPLVRDPFAKDVYGALPHGILYPIHQFLMLPVSPQKPVIIPHRPIASDTLMLWWARLLRGWTKSSPRVEVHPKPWQHLRQKIIGVEKLFYLENQSLKTLADLVCRPAPPPKKFSEVTTLITLKALLPKPRFQFSKAVYPPMGGTYILDDLDGREILRTEMGDFHQLLDGQTKLMRPRGMMIGPKLDPQTPIRENFKLFMKMMFPQEKQPDGGFTWDWR